MTKLYYYIRTEIYQINSEYKSITTRTFADIRRLCKLPFKIIAITMILSMIIMAILMILKSTSAISLFFILPIIFASILYELLPDKYLYNEIQRNEELENVYKNYKLNYIKKIKNILNEFNIDSLEKFLKFKSECERIVNSQKEKHIKAKKKSGVYV